MAHHAIDEFVEFDDTIEAVLEKIDLSETLVVVTADHRTDDLKWTLWIMTHNLWAIYNLLAW